MLHGRPKKIYHEIRRAGQTVFMQITNAGQLYLWKLLMFNISVLTQGFPTKAPWLLSKQWFTANIAYYYPRISIRRF